MQIIASAYHISFKDAHPKFFQPFPVKNYGKRFFLRITKKQIIIAILSLGVNKGMSLKLIVEGVDAQEAFSELKEFLGRSSE